ncbi:type 2 lantipeptide synthetase LanM, partial [Bacillus velezensis]|nr:type 2 lantipeptide synthetase LanM [Bacillus velezensis]
MNSLTNILLSKEKKAAVSQFDENEKLFDRNLELIYKNDIQMAQESIYNVLSIQSIDKVKSLYQTPLHKSAFTVHVFENLKKGIAHQAIKKEDVNEEIMFHVFALKVSSYFNDLLKKSKFPSYDYLLEQPALFHHSISNQLEKIILKVSYRTLVL